jgi:pimeloyl-ACP methyl ester carboxylesterase
VELAEGALMLPQSRNAGTANDLEQFDTLAPSDLASIRVPTLVLHGTADINVPFAMGELVAEEVPGAELVKVEGADHFMVISHSEEILGAMFAFLDRQQAN